MTLQGKVALITGASQGLGKEIARSYLQAGAEVALFARSQKLIDQTASEILPTGSAGSLLALAGDVTDDPGVAAIVAEVIRRFGRLDILVNNAGIYGPKGAIEDVDFAEWKQAIEINLLGTFIATRHAVPHLKAQKSGKIINLSGGGATKPMPFITSYAASKAAVVRLTESIALELQGFHIDVNAVAPGALNTRMLDEILQAGPEQVGPAYYKSCVEQQASGGASLVNAADLCIFLASAASDGITGRLISAVWDNWNLLPERAAELRESDIYTLRRITSKDRGRDWDK